MRMDPSPAGNSSNNNMDDEEVYESQEVIDDFGEEVIDNDEEDLDLGMEEMRMDEASATGSLSPAIDDDSQFTFQKHAGSVFCVSINPTQPDQVLTGGEDDVGYVWSVGSSEVTFKCDSHKDSVTQVGFSADGKLAVTADMSGVLNVWDTTEMKKIWSFEVSDLEWLEWHKVAPVLLCGTQSGEIWMWKIPSGDCKTFQSSGYSTTCGRYMPNGTHCCAGYQDGSVKLWNLKSSAAEQHFQGGREPNAVLCIDGHSENHMIFTGHANSTAQLLNASNGKLAAEFVCNPGSTLNEDSTEAAIFSPVPTIAATGTLSGIVSIWDLPTHVARHVHKFDSGIVKLQFDHKSDPLLIYSATLSGEVSLFDCRNGNVVRSWSGHTEEILDFQLSNDGNRIVTASSDNSAKVFDTRFSHS